MGGDGTCVNLNTWGVFLMHQIHMVPNIVRRWRMEIDSGAFRSLVNGRGLQLECARVALF